MSTLIEIEAAVDKLTEQEQQQLLEHLSGLVAKGQEGQGPTKEDREKWLQELKEMQERYVAGKQGIPQQQIWDEIREERI